MSRWPDFFVIGAAKAGTTALHVALSQRPEFALPATKETHFFSFGQHDERFSGPGDEAALNHSPLVRVVRDPASYLAQFTDVAGRQLGEVCPSYLYSPAAAEAIYQRCPDARLVAILRNPAERAFSAYLMLRESGREPEGDFRTALELEPRRRQDGWEHAWHYFEMGRYGQQLERFFERFSSAQIRVFLYEDLCHEPQKLADELLAFLGGTATDERLTLSRVNRSGLPRSTTVDRALRCPFPGRSLLRHLIPRAARIAVGKAVRDRNLERPELDRQLHGELLQRYDDDIRQLEQLIDRDLSAWRTARASNEGVL